MSRRLLIIVVLACVTRAAHAHAYASGHGVLAIDGRRAALVATLTRRPFNDAQLVITDDDGRVAVQAPGPVALLPGRGLVGAEQQFDLVGVACHAG